VNAIVRVHHVQSAQRARKRPIRELAVADICHRQTVTVGSGPLAPAGRRLAIMNRVKPGVDFPLTGWRGRGLTVHAF
jgi:hypothetical protein